MEHFNATDQSALPNYISNRECCEWIRTNVPGFECPDDAIQEIYYSRWWTFRKHLKKTSNGFVVTEFLPDVPWAGKHNTISCAAGNHFYEGRWIHDPVYLDAYARFWFSGEGEPRKYSFWAADAIYQRSLVSANRELSRELLPRLAGISGLGRNASGTATGCSGNSTTATAWSIP